MNFSKHSVMIIVNIMTMTVMLQSFQTSCSLNRWLNKWLLRLTDSTPAVPNCCCSKGSAPYWSNPRFLPERDYTRTLRSGLCCRKSVCRIVCRLSVPLVHTTEGIEAFGNISLLLCTLAILWPPCEILRRSSQGNPSDWGVKRKRGSEIKRWRTYKRLYLINGTR